MSANVQVFRTENCLYDALKSGDEMNSSLSFSLFPGGDLPFSLDDLNRTLMRHLAQKTFDCTTGVATVCVLALLVAIIVGGVLSNVIAMVVLGTYKNKSGTEHMLMYLAVTDLLLLLVAVFYVIYIFLICQERSIPTLNPLRALVHLFYLHAQLMGIMALIYLSVERYVAVCRPLSSRSFCTVGRSKRAMKWISGVVVAYYLHADVYYLYGEAHWQDNRTYIVADWIVSNVLDPIMVSFMPLLILAILNTKLVFALRQHPDKHRLNSNGATHSDINPEQDTSSSVQGIVDYVNRRRSFISDTRRTNPVPSNSAVTTLKVASIVLLFLITQSVQTILFYIERYLPVANTWDEVRTIAFTRFIFICLNSSLNCVIYCLCSRKFRWKLQRQFRCRKRNRERSSHAMRYA